MKKGLIGTLLFGGVLIGAAILIYRNIKKTPRKSNDADDNSFSNAAGRSALTAKPKRYGVMTTSERNRINQAARQGMFKKGICPPQCE